MAKNTSQFIQKLKKALPTMALCAAITLGCVAILWMHYQGRGGVAADFIKIVETKLLDFRFLLRGPVKPTGTVGILGMDEKTIQRFGRWPFARSYYEQAFVNLKKLGVRWVGLDVTWSEAERPLLEDAGPVLDRLRAKGAQDPEAWQKLTEMRAASVGDQSIARAVGEFGNVVMGYFYYASAEDAKALGDRPFTTLDKMLGSQIEMMIFPDGKELKDYPALEAKGAVGNTELISSAGQHFAFFNNESDDDAIMRWVTLVRTLNGHLMPSLSLKLAAESLGRQIVVFFDKFGIEEIGLVNPDDEADFIKIPVDSEGYGRVLINHYGPSKSLPHFSMADAYDNAFTEAEKKQLQGMTMILGPTAIAINDQRANPFDAGINGVEDHAAVVDNIVAKKFMKRPGDIYKTELTLVLVLGLVFSLILTFSSASISGLAALACLVGYYFFDKYYWFDRGIWAYMGMPYFNIFSLFMGVTLFKYFTEEKEKKKVKGAFAHYLSPDVINQVLADPDSLKLGGEKKVLTVFFSDMRNFTNISETLSPEKLCEFMNAYFTPMTGIILRSGGVLDKYIGDAIMAFWGAPLDAPDHADRGCIAAIQMLYSLETLREDLVKRGFPKIEIGCGLNTGPMSVGNMGSDERFCYTVMSDSVNLGSRLESKTKEYGIQIMISEFTKAKLTRKEIPTRDLDDITVKGKTEPVRVYEVMRPDILKSPQALNDLIGEFEMGRAQYRAQEWEKSKAHFMNCLRLRPDDKPSTIFLDRIIEYEKAPKIDGWDGVFHHKTK